MLTQASNGLLLEPDSSPYTATTLTTDVDIADDDFYTQATSNWWQQHYSYGIDCGSGKQIYSLTVGCYVADNSTPQGWYSTDTDDFSVYGGDAVDNWTFIEAFSAPAQDHQVQSQLGFTLTFASQTASYQYFKIVATGSGGVQIENGAGSSTAAIGEIQYNEEQGTTLVPGNTIHYHYADNVVWTPLGDCSTYHLHYADNVSLVPVLDVASTYHEHITGSPTLIETFILSPHDAYHEHHTTWPIRLDVPSAIITADLTIPFIEIETSFGMHADLTIPMIEIDASIVPTDEISIDLTIPMIEISAEMVSAANIDVDLTIPMIEISSSIVKGNNITGDLTIPMIEISTSIGSNNLITGSLTIPMIVVNSSIANDPPTIILKHSRY